MIIYKEYEKEVYNWLNTKNEQDPNFTFSLRQNGSKGAELDYFIGTEKSRYFAVTFWTIPVGFPGSSGDCIGLIFKLSADYKTYSYDFKFTQTNSPHDAQNTSALNLIKSVTKPIEENIGAKRVSADENKMFTIRTTPKQKSYTDLSQMLKDVSDGLFKLIPIINNQIEEEKKVNTDFEAHRITKEEFANMKSKLEVRFNKYAGINENNLKEEFIDWFFKLPKLKYTALNKENLSIELDQSNMFFDRKIFSASSSNYIDLIKYLKENTNIKGSPFYEYSSKIFNHRPRAILGKENYCLFLKEKFNNSIVSNTINYNGPTNQILYGPPGTGKTYATKESAVTIIDALFIDNLDTNLTKAERRKQITNKYKALYKKGQIVFTTFHQSMSYEDFVEGIKPKTEEKQVLYEVEDGIFKQIANKAKGVDGIIKANLNNVDFKNCNYFKMSLGGKNRKDVHDWCLENNQIALGYGGNNDINRINTIDWKSYKEEFQNLFPDEVEKSSYSVTATSIFKNWIKKGDIVLVSLGNHIIDAIGIVTGEYEYREFGDIPYHHYRKIDWLATNLDADPSLFVDKNISQQTIYQFNNDEIKVDYLEQTFSKTTETIPQPKEHVLIIDEINRGNVSAIFGELITLLEPDKRLGQKEVIQITLPYSKTDFGVPSNLHIIGTMNTADRSVEALDTALRRRFEFKEIMPEPSLLENIDIKNINLKELLETINKRIEILLDRDHTIGHSYFIKLEENDILGLKNAFKNNIIPLLQEYFYGDYEKIGLVLGKGFFNEKALSFDKDIFASFDTQNYPEKGKIFNLKTIDENFDIIKAINILLKKASENE